jgi:hypothetical protein
MHRPPDSFLRILGWGLAIDRRLAAGDAGTWIRGMDFPTHYAAKPALGRYHPSAAEQCITEVLLLLWRKPHAKLPLP